VPSAGEYPYRRDIASVFNPALVLALLAIQAVLVLWLPRRIQASSLWETERLRQEVSYRVDVLRDELKNAGPDPDSVEQAAYDLLTREVRVLAEFLHEHGRDLDQSQWRSVQNTLEQFRNARRQIDEDQLLRPLPPLDLDRAVRAAATARPPPEPEPAEGVEE
jgi:sensor domain CHASE-containing protein